MSQPTISSTDRIRDLSAINADVPVLLSSASAALRALTGDVSTTASPDGQESLANGTDEEAPPLSTAKKAFTTNAKAYFVTIQSIMARLRRQAYALEEAGIISAEAPVLASSAPQERRMGPGQRAQPEEERLVNGGLGNLDIAWLNSRVGKGGLEKEEALLDEAKELAEEALQKTKNAGEVEMSDA